MRIRGRLWQAGAALTACTAFAAPAAWADQDDGGTPATQPTDCASAQAEAAQTTVGPQITADIAASDLDCDLQSRIAAANAYIATRPGTVGYVIRDRKTGATYHSSRSGELVYTASAIKLLIATDLLVRQRAGQITLSDADKGLLHRMLNFSDNDAADALWNKFNGPGGQTLLRVFQAYGFIDEIQQKAPSASSMYWGNHKATPDDLGRLMLYILEQMNPADSAYLIDEMRHVDSNQQWGVWGAGPAMAPGNKDGWCQEDTGWVTNSVGFAGPEERYMLAIMNNLGSAGGQADGFATTTKVASILLAGRTE